MKVLVTGVAGQLGHDVMNELHKRGYEGIGTDLADKYSGNQDGSPVVTMPYVSMDITNKDSVLKTISEVYPDVVVHCAAWTAVDAAEDEENIEKVNAINADGTRYIAEACKRVNAKMLYISTDYVFNGMGEDPWKPEDKCDPISSYGKSKYEGELAVLELLEKFFIVRIAWVFGVNGNNFINTMLRLGKERKNLSVVDDQIGSPTYTFDLSVLLVDMIKTDKYGIYHATNEELCSWYEFACEIFRQASEYSPVYKSVSVAPIDSSSYPAKAKRPLNSRMDKQKLVENGFKLLPTWKDALTRYLKEITI